MADSLWSLILKIQYLEMYTIILSGIIVWVTELKFTITFSVGQLKLCGICHISREFTVDFHNMLILIKSDQNFQNVCDVIVETLNEIKNEILIFYDFYPLIYPLI